MQNALRKCLSGQQSVLRCAHTTMANRPNACTVKSCMPMLIYPLTLPGPGRKTEAALFSTPCLFPAFW